MTNPTINELFAAITADLKSKFGISSENDLKRVLVALAASDAAMLKLFYLAISDVRKNIYPDTADSEQIGGSLERFGRVKLGRDPYPAKQGVYKCTFSGVDGTTLLINSQLKSGAASTNPNQLFYTTESKTLSGTSGEITVTAANVGTDSELAVNDVIITVNPIININATLTVTEILTIPTDQEETENYRELVLQSFRLEPNGGSASDYVKWALDVAGIRTVYPFSMPSAAIIYAEATKAASTDGNGTPTQALMDALWKSDYTGVFEQDPDETKSDYDRGRRQLGLTDITIKPIIPKETIITITNLKTKTTAIEQSIFDSIANVLYQKRPYVAGVGNINNRNDTVYFYDIITAITNAVDVGNTYDSLKVKIDGFDLPYKCTDGNIPYLKEVIYD